MKTLFFVSLFGAVYSYFLYPAILLLLPRRTPTSLGPDDLSLTLIVTAHNESGRIRAKLVNSLTLDYPVDRLQIIVASDCSEDGTDAIAGEFRDQGVKLVRAEERRGKEHAQKLALEAAGGEIIVFSDVATKIPRDGLQRLAQRFRDPRVGAVSSEDRFVTPDGRVVGEGLYVRYEMWLRRLESRVSSLVGLSGSFFAARREVCADWDVFAPSDFNTALNCVRKGYVAVSAPEVVGTYAAIADERREYQRKFRTVLRGITGLMRHPEVLNPLRYGLFAFQVLSHKVMRWLVPWFLLLALVSSAMLAPGSWFYALAVALQLPFYALVISGMLMPSLRQHLIVKVPFFFIQANIAIAHATLAYITGTRMTVWQPSKR